MLVTLLKYEFKSNGRLLLPLYGAWLVAAVLLGLSIRTDNMGNNSATFIIISGILYGTFAMVAVVITCIILIQRFYKNLLGNEGYLMFALPVTTGQHIINKLLSAAVWGTIGIIAAILSGLLIAGCIEGFGTLFDNMEFLIYDMNEMIAELPNAFVLLIEVLLVVFMAFAVTAAKVYAAIAIGHQWSNHRVIGAIAAYIGLGIIESILGNLSTGLQNAYINWTADLSNNAQVHLIMTLLIVAGVIGAAIYGFVSWKLLDKRLNLE